MKTLRASAAAAVTAAALGVATPLFAQTTKPAPMPAGDMSGMNMQGMSASDMAQMRAMMARMDKMMADCEHMMKEKSAAKNQGSTPPAAASPGR